MSIISRHRFAVFSVALLGAVVGCSSDEDAKDPAGDGDGDGDAVEVEMVSFWKGPGEAEALAALVAVHKENYPNVRLFNSSEDSGVDSELTIEERLAAGDPPDVFQENVSDIPAILEEFPGSIEPLDDLFEKNGWNDVFLPEVLEAITIDGSIYAMPVGVHRENATLINKSLFTAQDQTAPTSVEELLATCEAFDAEGITCLATGGQGWIVRIMFFQIMLGTMGGEEFQKFFAGEGDPDDPKFAESIDHLQTILDNYIDESLWITEGCVDFNMDPIDRCLDGSRGWDLAAQSLFDGDAAMFMHGDWAGGLVQQLGWEAGVDYSVVGSPGAADTFLFGVDTFVLPADAKNKEGALQFFETIGSLEGQAAFNNIKGSTPIRLDADKSLLTAVGKAALEDLSNATVIMGAPSFTDHDAIILDFANGALTKEELIAKFAEALY